VALNPEAISTSCPYCMVMLGDAVAAKKSSGEAAADLEVIDVAQLLVRSVRSPKAAKAGDPVSEA
jgi:Fe-S oxidoreductase